MNNKKFIIAVSVSVVVIIAAAALAINFIKNSDGRIAEPTPAVQDETPEEQKEMTEAEKIKAYNDGLSSDIKEMVSTLKQFQNANGGRVPTDWNIYYDVYLDSTILDKYDFALCDMASGTCPNALKLTWQNNPRIVYVAKHAICRGDNIVYSNSSKKVAFVSVRKTADEGKGNVCLNN